MVRFFQQQAEVDTSNKGWFGECKATDPILNGNMPVFGLEQLAESAARGLGKGQIKVEKAACALLGCPVRTDQLTQVPLNHDPVSRARAKGGNKQFMRG